MRTSVLFGKYKNQVMSCTSTSRWLDLMTLKVFSSLDGNDRQLLSDMGMNSVWLSSATPALPLTRTVRKAPCAAGMLKVVLVTAAASAR